MGGMDSNIFRMGLGRADANFTPLSPLGFLTRSASIYPDRVAVIHGDRRIAYRDLDLRARAVENQVFMLAAAQVGSHPPGLACYGNAMIVDPWGTVLARAPEEECVVVADLDFDHQDRVRASLPALNHRRTEILGL